MTKLSRTLGRPARRPVSGARITAALLASLGLAGSSAPAYADDLAVPAALDSGGTLAEVQEPVPDEVGSLPGEAEAPGGAVAPAAEPPAPVPADVPEPEPVAPPEEPAPVVPEPVPAVPEPVGEPDPAPVAEPIPEPEPWEPGPPGSGSAPAPPPANLNVDIRIFSPGDNGDVVQEVTAPLSAPSGEHAAGPGWEWNWNWTWNWTWTCDWHCAAPDATPLATAPELPVAPTESPAQVLEPQPPAQPTPPDDGGEVHAPRAELRQARPEVMGAPVAGVPLSERVAAVSGLLADRPKAAARSRAGERPTPSGATEGSPDQRLLWQPLVGSAASTAPPGGSPSLLLVVLFAALSLLAPRATETAWMRVPRLRSLIESQRLERPG